jgi:hypothetical protein
LEGLKLFLISAKAEGLKVNCCKAFQSMHCIEKGKIVIMGKPFENLKTNKKSVLCKFQFHLVLIERYKIGIMYKINKKIKKNDFLNDFKND